LAADDRSPAPVSMLFLADKPMLLPGKDGETTLLSNN
jgi:hypothetical protein